MDELLKAVRAYALDHYEQGWDVLIECHSDAEIIEAIGKAKTVKGAIANVSRNLGIKVFASHRRDIEGEIF